MRREKIVQEAKRLEKQGVSIEKQIEVLELIRDGGIKIPRLTNQGWVTKTEKEWERIDNEDK